MFWFVKRMWSAVHWYYFEDNLTTLWQNYYYRNLTATLTQTLPPALLLSCWRLLPLVFLACIFLVAGRGVTGTFKLLLPWISLWVFQGMNLNHFHSQAFVLPHLMRKSLFSLHCWNLPRKTFPIKPLKLQNNITQMWQRTRLKKIKTFQIFNNFQRKLFKKQIFLLCLIFGKEQARTESIIKWQIQTHFWSVLKN